MINANLYKHDDVYIGFSINGHAGYADFGSDIACASVTSAVQLTINAITEVLGESADVDVLENEISIKLSNPSVEAKCFLEAFNLHLHLLADDFEGTIKITDVEV